MKNSMKSMAVGALASMSVIAAPMTAWADEKLVTPLESTDVHGNIVAAGQGVTELANSGAAIGGLAGLAVLAILGGAILLRRRQD